MFGVDEHEIEGYKACRNCGAMVLDAVAFRTTFLCLGCFNDGIAELRTVEVMNRGARVVIPMGSKKRNRVRPKRYSPNQRLAEHAQRSAWRRLASIYPDLYEMLYDEERARRGLQPIIRRGARSYTEIASETLTFDDVYDALHSLGDIDG